jgi:hypothetical protein
MTLWVANDRDRATRLVSVCCERFCQRPRARLTSGSQHTLCHRSRDSPQATVVMVPVRSFGSGSSSLISSKPTPNQKVSTDAPERHQDCTVGDPHQPQKRQKNRPQWVSELPLLASTELPQSRGRCAAQAPSFRSSRRPRAAEMSKNAPAFGHWRAPEWPRHSIKPDLVTPRHSVPSRTLTTNPLG